MILSSPFSVTVSRLYKPDASLPEAWQASDVHLLASFGFPGTLFPLATIVSAPMITASPVTASATPFAFASDSSSTISPGSSFVIHSLVLLISISKSIPACSKAHAFSAKRMQVQFSYSPPVAVLPAVTQKNHPLAITITKSGS